jgi:hypothetical protein
MGGYAQGGTIAAPIFKPVRAGGDEGHAGGPVQGAPGIRMVRSIAGRAKIFGCLAQ